MASVAPPPSISEGPGIRPQSSPQQSQAPVFASVNVEKYMSCVEKPLDRNYEKDLSSSMKLQPLDGPHPLVLPPAPAAVVVVEQKQQSQKPASPAIPALPLDPLGAADTATSSPLSPLSPAQRTQSRGTESQESTAPDPEFLPWTSMKPSILQEFTTDQQIGITVSFINTPATGKVKMPQDRTVSRLEELEQGEDSEGKQFLQVTQKEYVKHIETMHNDLITAWNHEDRVRTLKIAIQCSKLLLDTAVPKFYPSKFVLVTEILDTFGKLVFDRIRLRRIVMNVATNTPLPEKDIPQHIKDMATETCRNWFYKIASIRELIPRIYTEMAILKCYTFLEVEPPFREVVTRLSRQIRGIGDPMVQFYAQCYLARKAHDVLPNEKSYLVQAFSDLLQVYEALGPKINTIREKLGGLPQEDYMHLYSPGLEWIISCIAYKSSPSLLEEVLQIYRKGCKNAMFLNHIISSFPPGFITANTLLFTSLIRDADTSSFPQYQLYRTLGINLALGAPPLGQELAILNDIWKVVTKLENVSNYMITAEVFVEYCLKHCTPRDVNTMLADIFRHVKKDNSHEHLQQHLLSIMQKVTGQYEDITTVFSMEHFGKLLDLLTGDAQVSASKIILEAFTKHKGTVTDPLIINTLFNVATVLHDTVNSLSLADEVRQITRIISHFVFKIDFGRDVEKQLNFYVECRQCFANLDRVKEVLVQCVCQLCMRTLSLARGKHNKKTSAFIRACIAFCYITIPSMEDTFTRLNLSLLAGEVALVNQSIPQADSLFRAAITLIPEIPTSCGTDKAVEEELASFVGSLCGALVVAPGHPDNGPFYLVQGLLKVLKDYPWAYSSYAKLSAYGSILRLLFAYYQRSLPYHIDKVDSNDTLYRNDLDYDPELQKLIPEVFTCYMEHVEILKQQSDCTLAASKGAVDMLNIIAGQTQLNSKSIPALLAMIATARGVVGTNPYLRNTLWWLQEFRTAAHQDLVKRAASGAF